MQHPWPRLLTVTSCLHHRYIGIVMLSNTAPGLPVWQTPPETWQSVLNQSLNVRWTPGRQTAVACVAAAVPPGPRNAVAISLR